MPWLCAGMSTAAVAVHEDATDCATWLLKDEGEGGIHGVDGFSWTMCVLLCPVTRDR